MTELTKLDYWLLARCIAGYRIDYLTLKGSPSLRAADTLDLLEQLTVRERESILKNRIDLEEWKRVAKVDTESAEPPDRNESIPPGIEATHQHESWFIVRATELQKLPPVTWLIPGELPDNALTMLYGASGSGKSFMALDYALRIAQKDTVLYGAFEGEYGYKARIDAWRDYHPGTVAHNLFLCMGSVEMMRGPELARFVVAAQQINPRLVIVDTVAMSMIGGDENSARDMGMYIRACKTLIREIRCAVMLVHHTNKAGLVERGSGALRGSCDMMIRLSMQDDVIVKECSKSKDTKLFDTTYHRLLPRELHANGQALQSAVIVPADRILQLDSADLTPNQQKMLETLALSVYSEAGCSFADIEADTGIAPGALSRISSRLIGLEFIRREGKAPVRLFITDKGKEKLRSVESVESVDSHDSHARENNSPGKTPNLPNLPNLEYKNGGGPTESPPTQPTQHSLIKPKNNALDL
jgi:DNA-binding MarR family transcriptional regulator